MPLSEAVPVLRVDAADDLAEPAFMLWGAVPSSVAELEVRSDDFDKISTDITHPGYQGVEFVVYVAPYSGHLCDIEIGFLDEGGASMPIAPNVSCSG